MIDTTAARELADKLKEGAGLDTQWDAAKSLRQCADEIDRQSEIIDGLSMIIDQNLLDLEAKDMEIERLNDELHSLTGGAWTDWQKERDTLRELLWQALEDERSNISDHGPDWKERAEKALGD